jgi:hypothetical protein
MLENFEEKVAAAKKRKKDRLDICETCPRLFKPTWSCKECGCFMKVKAGIKIAKCPLGKW